MANVSIQVNDGGTWRVPQPYVNDDGTWRIVSKVYYNDAGSWKQVFGVVDGTPLFAGDKASATDSSSGQAVSTWTTQTVDINGNVITAHHFGGTNVTQITIPGNQVEAYWNEINWTNVAQIFRLNRTTFEPWSLATLRTAWFFNGDVLGLASAAGVAAQAVEIS